MSAQIPEVDRSEDGTYRYRWSRNQMWIGGYPSMDIAFRVALQNRPYCIEQEQSHELARNPSYTDQSRES
jgi:hypothetical protein